MSDDDTDPGIFLLWSNGHECWIAPGAGRYVREFEEADHFSRADALLHATNAAVMFRSERPLLLPVRLIDMRNIQCR